jgi:hypothetical protein
MATFSINAPTEDLKAGDKICGTNGKVAIIDRLHLEPVYNPLKGQGIDLSTAKKGDICVLFNGDRLTFVGRTFQTNSYDYTLTGVYPNGFSVNHTYTKEGIYYLLSEHGRRNIKEVLPFVAPVIGIDGYPADQEFLDRSGTRLRLLAEHYNKPMVDSSKHYQLQQVGGTLDGQVRLYSSDGKRYCNAAQYDIVEVLEVIPARKPSLFDRISNRLAHLDSSVIEKIVISDKDFSACEHLMRFVGGDSYFQGVRLIDSCFLASEEFRIVLKFS